MYALLYTIVLLMEIHVTVIYHKFIQILNFGLALTHTLICPTHSKKYINSIPVIIVLLHVYMCIRYSIITV